MSIPPASRIYVVTTNFPFTAGGGEVMFVAPEMKRLLREGVKVIVAPLYPGGSRAYEDEALELDMNLSRRLRKPKPILALNFLIRLPFLKNSKFFLTEIFHGFRRWGVKGGAKALWWSFLANVAYEWAVEKNKDSEIALFYTYWNTATTVGLVLAAQSLKNIKVVTRVHRYDLYEERSAPPYLPYRPWLYKAIDRVFGISKDGVEYVCDRGLDPSKASLNYLGTEDPGELCSASSDGVLRVLSCSFVVPVKRVDLMAKSLIRLAENNKQLMIQWTHLGGGPLLSDIESILRNRPQNLDIRLAGHVKNSEVLDFYRRNCVDLLLNLSESEGLPVSMMEALSFGVPIIATDVGGVREIVNQRNGFLLSANPTVEEVVQGLKSFVELSKENKQLMRKACRFFWLENFNAEACHTSFSLNLINCLRDAAP